MAYHFLERLEECMTKEKAFLNPHLTLSELARRVGTNRTYLSNYLNNELKVSFFDYVNAYRLEHLHNLLLTTNYTLEVLAECSGFRSLSTLRRRFALRYGCPIFIYRRDHQAASAATDEPAGAEGQEEPQA